MRARISMSAKSRATGRPAASRTCEVMMVRPGICRPAWKCNAPWTPHTVTGSPRTLETTSSRSDRPSPSGSRSSFTDPRTISIHSSPGVTPTPAAAVAISSTPSRSAGGARRNVRSLTFFRPASVSMFGVSVAGRVVSILNSLSVPPLSRMVGGAVKKSPSNPRRAEAVLRAVRALAAFVYGARKLRS